MAQEIARQWFVPGEGIDRHVISADIQRYLGNDATVRPGLGTGEHQGMPGYWIKAYRNLTSAMILDLRQDSARWRAEQRSTGTREPYVGSQTHHKAGIRATRRENDSPSLEGPYGLPQSSHGERAPVDRMQIDPPAPPSGRGGYPAERTYQPDGRAYPQDTRGYAPDSRSVYPPEQSMPSSAYGGARPPVTSSYSQDPRYASAYAQPNDGAPPGYYRSGNMFIPISQYDQPQSSSVPRTNDPYGSNPYGPQPQARDPRDPRDARDPRDIRDPRDLRDPRYSQAAEYTDPRYAYPSPAATVSSVVRDREPVSSPPSNPYGTMPPQNYDQYSGRPVVNPNVQVNAGTSAGYSRNPSGTNASGQDRRTRR